MPAETPGRADSSIDVPLNQLPTNANAVAAETAGPLITEPALVFAAVMAVILFAPIIVSRFRVPGIIGIILAGIALGPNALFVLDRTDTIVLLGTVGLLYIMFLAGLDIDLNQFRRYRKHSLVFGGLTFLLPQVLGTIVALFVLNFNWMAAILLASMFASHTLVSYPIAHRLGITRNRAVTTGVGGTIITDTLALLVLAIVAASVSGELSTGFWLRLVMALCVYVTFMLWLVPIIGRLFFKHVADGGVRDYVFVLVVAFGGASLATVAGVEAIIGAFLAGLALNTLIPHQSPLMNRIEFFGNAIFVPYFLIYVGMLVDLKLLWAGSHVWLVGGTMVVCVTVTKWLAAKAAATALGYSAAEGDVLFGLSVPQAAATLAAVFVGFRIGLFDDAVLNGAVMMILVTCLIGPWVVERQGRTIALAESLSPDEPGAAPLRILIPLANPASAPALMDVAFMIRRPDSPEPLYPIMVANESLDVDRQIAAGEKMLGYAVTYASGAGVPVSPVTRIDTSIANGITRAIREMRISTVVIGWSGAPSRRRQHLGSVLDQILHDNPQTVLICKFNTPINTTQRVVPILPRLIDREPSFAEAIRTIKLMTSKLGAKLVVVTTDADLPRLQPRLSKVKPQVPTSFETINPWSSLMPRLQSVVHGDDMLVLLSTREGRLAWTPDLSRLPRRLVDQFPSQNLVIFHPAEVTAETAWFSSGSAAAQTPEPATAEGGSPAAPSQSSLLAPSRVLLNLHAREFAISIEQVIASEFQHRAAALREVRDALIRNATEYSTEVTSGVALLHAHVPHVEHPRFFLATFTEGLEVPRITEPVHVLLILLSPDRLPPEEHLRSLAHIARLMRSTETTCRIRESRDFSEVLNAVGGM